jgi:hypothetical protein
MSDEWTVESETPRKKGGLPAWFWWTCGSGCLVAVLVAVAVGVLAVLAGKKMTDPEYVKGQVKDVLPADAWPEGYEPMFGGGMFGAGAYSIKWNDPTGVAIVKTVPGRTDLDKEMAPDVLQNKLPNRDLQAGQMELKGRTVNTLRFKDLNGLMHLRTDISGDNAPYATVEITLPQSDQARLEEATLKFLEPFDIWRGEG